MALLVSLLLAAGGPPGERGELVAPPPPLAPGLQEHRQETGETELRRPRQRSPYWPVPDHWLELAVSGESSIALGYRSLLPVGGGHGGVGLIVTDEDDWVLEGELMRFGRPQGDLPLTLGVGLGLYAAFPDEPSADAYAVTFIGAAEYTFATSFPTSVGLEVAFAPDATTFDDGESLIDLTTRVGIELGSYARAFAGYRFLEVGLQGEDAEVENALQIGIGLAW